MPRTDVVDLSKWQGVQSVATFAAWRAAGISTVILKMGGGNDGRYKDKVFDQNRANAQAAGLIVQGYWFNGTTDVTADADFACGLVEPGFFIWADVENEGSMPSWNDWQAGAFEARVEQNGRRTGTYMSQSVTFRGWPSVNHRPLWVAAYGPSSVPAVGNWHGPVLWQHTSSGRLPGYGGPLDFNESQPGFAALINVTPIPEKEDTDMAFLPICIQSREGGPAVPGIAIFANGFVEAITREQWDAFGFAGAQQYYTTVPGHFQFFLDQAARVRASYGVKAAVPFSHASLEESVGSVKAAKPKLSDEEAADIIAEQIATATGSLHGVQFTPLPKHSK